MIDKMQENSVSSREILEKLSEIKKLFEKVATPEMKEARLKLMEALKQMDLAGEYPDVVIGCVGGGSNSIGFFAPYIDTESPRLIGVEAGGSGEDLGQHAARFQGHDLQPQPGHRPGTQ